VSDLWRHYPISTGMCNSYASRIAGAPGISIRK
jgi:hypothetical protein